jgi:O-antigen/teichoic acid export membrane protein
MMIKWMIGSAGVGHYQAGIKIIQLGLMLPYLINTAIYPILVHLQDQHEKLAHILQKSFRGLYLIGLPLGIIGLTLLPAIFIKIYGPNYLPGLAVLKWLLLAMMIDYGLFLINNALLVLNLQKKSLQISALAIISNVCLNLLLIPIIGISGAAIATLISKSIDMTLSWKLLKKTLNSHPIFPKKYGSILLYATVPALISKGLLLAHIPLILTVIITGSSYLALIMFTKDHTTQDLVRNIFQILRVTRTKNSPE